MLFLTRWFGVTGSEGDRSPAREQSDIKEITERVLLMQANAAARQRQPLRRGTHAKGICARAQFEVFDVTVGRDPKLARRLARGIFSTPGVYPPLCGLETRIQFDIGAFGTYATGVGSGENAGIDSNMP
jgi:hypothetical protein